ncbi:tripartite tricarboxylate transporter substrate binding protein [Hydrogenophaga sp.]|uniref:Bug family tripartite tricarboxylate transporter substrate binding protein n=1 Tax=Hydrogenophaga sp. TaxID=1904254 RepID=UPI0027285AC1|nr:tripartite tricarboxylate transporter substrate binding protein [Hydrogenophaga sp.]MDO9436366.1 tripartite tricarboxylate transporter substrate binding protein [Hydrogenophaga sp.]
MLNNIRSLKRLGALALVAFTCAATAPVHAQPYPSRPIRLIVPFGPGGGNDLLARITALKLTESMGQPVVVENRPGASGVIGTQAVQRATPDGYTIVIGGTPLTVNQTLRKDIPYDVLKDFTPISLLVLQPNVLVVNPKVEATTLKDLLAMAKAQPGKLNYATGSNGSAPHLSGELMKVMGGVDIVQVPYNGAAPAMNAVLSGEVTIAFDQPATSLPHIQAGKLRPIAVTGAARSPQLPNVPTMAEAGLPGFEVNSWFGILGPANMPKDIAARLSSEFAKALNSPDVRDRLTQQGFTVVGGTSDEMGAFLKADVASFKRIIEASKMKAE